MEIIGYEEKEMIPLTHEENTFYKEQEAWHICKEKFCTDKYGKSYINKRKVKDNCHYTGKFREAAHSKCNLNYKVPKDIPVIIHNATYDTHFIINQLTIEFKGEINCIGDNMEKYKSFSAPIKKECTNGKIITYTTLSLLIVLDLGQLHYQNLLITRLEFLIVYNVNHA